MVPRSNTPTEPTVRHEPLASSSDIRGRLKDLESRVLRLMHNSGVVAETPICNVRTDAVSTSITTTQKPEQPTLPAQTSSESGTLHSSPAGTVYTGGAHWTAILDSISEMKDYFEEQEDIAAATPVTYNSAPCSRDGPQLLFGCNNTVTKDDILAAIPERTIVDRLIFYYFNALVMPPSQYS